MASAPSAARARSRDRAGARLRAVTDVTNAILEGADVDETFRRVASHARSLVGAQMAVIGTLVEGDAASLRVRAVEGPPAAQVRPGTLVPVARTLAAEALRTGRRSVFSDAARSSRGAFEETARVMGIGPVIAIPLVARGRVFGALGVANRSGEPPFADADARLVEAFAAQAAVALELSRARAELERLAVVEERERIARDLHDGVIQSLFGIGMQLQGLAEGDLAEPARARLAAAVDGIDGAIRDLRNYIFGLRPGVLADRQLDQAIQDLARAFEERSGVAAGVEVDPVAASLLAPAASDVAQIVREALSNVARHAHARHCVVRLWRAGRTAHVEVADDGRGIEPSAAGRGQGLTNMRARAVALGGSTRIYRSETWSTVVEVSLPL